MKTKSKWPSELVLVRHGESESNVAHQEARRSGAAHIGVKVRDMSIRLTERGMQQAEMTGREGLGQRHFDFIYCSPYRRCRETIEAIRPGLAASCPGLLLDDRLRERELGIFDGITKSGRRILYPEEHERSRRLGKYYYRPPGGESLPDVGLRLHSFLGTLTRDCREKSVLVVTHSLVILMFRKLLERLTEGDVHRIDRDRAQEIHNCSVTEYRLINGGSGKLGLERFAQICYPPEWLQAWVEEPEA